MSVVKLLQLEKDRRLLKQENILKAQVRQLASDPKILEINVRRLKDKDPVMFGILCEVFAVMYYQ